MTVYFFYGDEDYNIEKAIEAQKKSLDKNFTAMNYRHLDNPTFPDLIEALRVQGLMFGKMLTVIDCNKYFEKSFEDSQLKEIESALENNMENSDVVFVATLPRNENKKLDSRKKIFKILSKYNAQEFSTFKLNYYGKQDLSAWLKKLAKAKGITLEQDVIDSLIEQIGNNLREFDFELDKLKLLAYPEKNITKSMVKEICISNEDLFNFIELLMSQNFDKALVEYNHLLDKKHPLEILSATQTILRKRILLKINANKSIDEIVEATGMSAKQVNAILKVSKNQSLKNLVHLKENLTNAEFKIKSGTTADIESEVQNAFLR
ncbi:MAG: DNA polymerase III subunit delta [Candidatus Gastranaerophilaceae bacterium]